MVTFKKDEKQDVKILNDGNLILGDFLQECAEEKKKGGNNTKTDPALLNG